MKQEIPYLPVCTPEEVGIPSQAILRYLQALKELRIAMHDVLIMRHGKLCAEAYWTPFDATFRHRLYSCSKSFTAIAVGILIEQGKLSLDDRALSFFADKAPKNPHPWLMEMTIRDLLRMATCFEEGTCFSSDDPDWADTFFDTPITHRSGAVYAYCTTGTTMLCMIIKRVSGMELMGVLRPAFDALGISKDAFCVQTPCGYEWGGSGICLTAREFLLFADLCTHYGSYQGVQLLPRGYLKEATSKQIDNGLEGNFIENSAGYGYQFFLMRRGFSMRGMGGQYALCFPEYDLTIVTNAYDKLNEPALNEVFTGFFREIEPALSDFPLPADHMAAKSLRTLVNTLKLPAPNGDRFSPMAARINGKTFWMEENRLGWQKIRFQFESGAGELYYENARGAHTLRFGLGEYLMQPFPETHYAGQRIGMPLGHGYNAWTAAAWTMENSLMLYCHIADIYHGNLRIAFGFDENSVSLYARKHAEWFLDDYEGFASGYMKGAEGEKHAQ